MAELADGFEIDTKAAEVIDEADGEQAGAGDGCCDFFEGVVDESQVIWTPSFSRRSQG